MNKRRLILRALIPGIALLSSSTLVADEAPKLEGAERTWAFYCEGCHAAGIEEHPATLRLSYTRSPELAAIRGRQDLTPEYLRQVVRLGYLEMVGFRKTEISDSELEALIKFIRKPEQVAQ